MWRAPRDQSPTQTDKVIQMDRFRSGKSLSPLRQAEAYWAALCDGQTVPRRSQIDPRGLENILPYTCVLERIAPGVARFRVAGQHLHQLAGMEIRGMPLSSLFTSHDRAEFAALQERVFQAPAIAELSLASEIGMNEARMILLPLRSDMDDINRALGVIVAEQTQIATPSRFSIQRSNLRPVPGMVRAPLADPHPAQQGFAEAQAAFSGKAPHLRVVK